MTRFGTRNRKPSARALEAAASAAAAAALISTSAKKRARTGAKNPANASTAGTKKAPAKKLSNMTATNDSSSESEDEGNECADDKDRKWVLNAPDLEGVFPFVEERIVGERRLNRCRGKSHHHYLISAMPQWINAERADEQMVASWNKDDRLIVELSQEPFIDMRIMRGHPLLDELQVMGTSEWRNAEAICLADKLSLQDQTVYGLLGVIIRESVALDQLTIGIDQYQYADKESADLADELNLGPAPELVQNVQIWALDTTLEEMIEQEPRLPDIEITVIHEESGTDYTICASSLFYGVQGKLLEVFNDGVKRSDNEIGLHFMRNTTIAQRHAIGRDIIRSSPHFITSKDLEWMPLLIALLLPLQELQSMLPALEDHMASWQTDVINHGMAEYHTRFCSDECYTRHVLPTFANLSDIMQHDEYNDDFWRTDTNY
jgi:hypothetical protein